MTVDDAEALARPSVRVRRICAANVAIAAMTIPTMFWEVPERMLR